MSIDVGVASIISGVELQFYVQHFLPLNSFRCARWTRSLRYIKLNEVTIFSLLYVHVKREQEPKKKLEKNEHKVLNSFALIKHWLHEKFDKTLDLWNIFYYKVAIVPFRSVDPFKKNLRNQFSLWYIETNFIFLFVLYQCMFIKPIMKTNSGGRILWKGRW